MVNGKISAVISGPINHRKYYPGYNLQPWVELTQVKTRVTTRVLCALAWGYFVVCTAQCFQTSTSPHTFYIYIHTTRITSMYTSVVYVLCINYTSHWWLVF